MTSPSPTFETLLSDNRNLIDAAERRKAALGDQMRAVVANVRAQHRASPSLSEKIELDRLVAGRSRYDDELAALRDQRQTLTAVAEQEAEIDRQLQRRDANASGVAASRSYDQVARVGRERRTYSRESAGGGGEFLMDVARSVLNHDAAASQRLGRHMDEEQVERGGQLQHRAAGTGAFAGLTVPQYLTDLYAPAVSALSPTADICNQHPLPPAGMSVNISRITTPTGVGLQATENTAVLNQDIDDTLLQEQVQTIAGQQTISRQAIDRGIGIEDVVVDDLLRRHAAALDSVILNQAVTGLSALASPTTYTSASPTGPELYPKILGAAAASETALLGLAVPDVAIMHSRRWTWLTSQMTNQFPMIGQPGIPGQNAGVNNATPYGSGFRGTLPNGLAVVVDNNIGTAYGAGTNEDEIYVTASRELHLWRDPQAPIFIRAEQPAAGSLGVQLVIYSYFAFSARRFTGAVSKIAGTGLKTPAF